MTTVATAVLPDSRLGSDLVDPELFRWLVRRVGDDHPDIGADIAHRCADQALAFLAAAGQCHGEPLVPCELVDYVWHAFMLHSTAYVRFCQQVAGHYIHHVPDDAPGSPVHPARSEARRRTLDAITAAGFRVDRELWQMSGKCGSCHEDGNCSASGERGNENTDTRK